MASQGISSKYVEGLRLSERDRTLLLDQMKKNGLADRRKSPRMVVEGTFSVLLTMEATGGSPSFFRIYPWELSRGSLGFFHRSFVYPGTRCSFTGLTFGGEPFTLKGEVVRCAHVSGNVHTVGAKLDAEIEPEHFLGGGGVPDGIVAAEDWWTQVVARAAAVSKLGREKAPADAIRAAAKALAQHLATDPATITVPTPAADPAAPAEPAHQTHGSGHPAHAAPAAKAA